MDLYGSPRSSLPGAPQTLHLGLRFGRWALFLLGTWQGCWNSQDISAKQTVLVAHIFWLKQLEVTEVISCDFTSSEKCIQWVELVHVPLCNETTPGGDVGLVVSHHARHGWLVSWVKGG
jgi:hypothetical protein